MRLAWITDPHLDFVGASICRELAEEVRALEAEGVLLGGDIAESRSLPSRLWAFAEAAQVPVWFVLGNHDYYRSSVADVRVVVRTLCENSPWLHWLPAEGLVLLTEASALVGHGGFGDARNGLGAESQVELSDFDLIADLAGLAPRDRAERLRALADDGADLLRRSLEGLHPGVRRVVVLTHVPPFPEAAWHDGRPCTDAWLPYFSCRAIGDVLLAFAASRPDVVIQVLCGHTHSDGSARLLPNLGARCSGASYGAPRVSGLFDVR
jgi:3',5'-cyclic AMP phosphodiesterase CpdA